jgi:hypothetical protein
MTCLCERCTDNPAPTYTQAFLIRCLAEEIAATKGLAARQGRLAAWEGRAIEAELKRAVKAAFEERVSKGAGLFAQPGDHTTG